MASQRSNGHNRNELRMVMVGKTGNGKSTTGNTILGLKCFKSKFSAKSITVECSTASAVVCNQPVTIIDTPGLFDTRFGVDKTTKEMSQCISFSLPGPHIFLVVIRLGRYTVEEQQTVQRIQEIFGQAADKYSMVLFTGGDLIEGTTIEEFLAESPELQQLVSRCNNQYHVFNNKSSDGTQVTELVRKIRAVVQRNGGSHYTNEMFQAAERAVEEKKQRILREKEEIKRREQEERERKLQEEVRRREAQIRAEWEREKWRRDQEAERRRQEMELERRRALEEWEEERRQREREKQVELERERRRLEEQRQRVLEEEREKERERERERERRREQEEEGCVIL